MEFFSKTQAVTHLPIMAAYETAQDQNDDEYLRHILLKKHGYYDQSKTKDERLALLKQLGISYGDTAA